MALVSPEEVRRFARNFAQSPDEIEDLVYSVTKMVDSLAVYANRVESTMSDVIVAFAFLCRFSIPGKPPTDDRTRRKVTSLMRMARQQGVQLFFLPPSAVNAIVQEMSPLNLLIDLEALAKLGFRDRHIQETPFVWSRNRRLTPLGNIIESIGIE